MYVLATVLIESDWNLKDIENEPEQSNFFGINRIRLEFKDIRRGCTWSGRSVLIESDWNLKYTRMLTEKCCYSRINRIRLEFKELTMLREKDNPFSINRIRLEFKGYNLMINLLNIQSVLIESDWNLKPSVPLSFWPVLCINRIRLEFKV